MALVVTVAGATSDSYATLAEALDFLIIKQSTAWTDASDALKESAMKTAAAMMDELRYHSPKSATTQALRFPLTVNTVDGSFVIPDRIKRAQSYLAAALLESPSLFAGTDGVASVAVTGSFQVTFDAAAADGFQLPDEVQLLLDRYFWKSGASGSPNVWTGAGRTWI